jgi:hypothetical protein
MVDCKQERKDGATRPVKRRIVYGTVQCRRQILRTNRILQENNLVSSLFDVINDCNFASPNKSSYQIRNPVIACHVASKQMTI